MLDQKNEQRMRELLSQGVPFVVNGVKLQGTYDPKYFSNKYHGDPCKIYFIEQGSTEETTVNEFFSMFGHLCAPEARAKLKVIPTILSLHSWSNSLVGLAPEKHFRTKFAELYDAVIAAIPFLDTMMLNGACNLAAHFPTNGLPPDLGKYHCHSCEPAASIPITQVQKCTMGTFSPIPCCTWT